MSDTEQLDEILKAAIDKAFKHRSAKGGNTTKKRHGKEYYAEIGRKGALKRAENREKKLSTGDE